MEKAQKRQSPSSDSLPPNPARAGFFFCFPDLLPGLLPRRRRSARAFAQVGGLGRGPASLPLHPLLAEATPFELVAERAKQSGRRVGMFLTGDFGHAARTTIRDFPQADAQEIERPGGLEKLAKQLPALADLLRLAIRPEYADARWHQPSQAAQRLASGKLRPV